MKPETTRLVRMIVPSKVLGGQATSAEEKSRQRETIFGGKGVLSVLNDRIEKTGSYVCGT